MFLVSALFIILSAAIYKGKTDLIHDYHQRNVTDRAAYGKAFGKALLAVAAAPLLSGLLALCGDSRMFALLAVAVLVLGIGIGFACLVAVQKKYNNGIF